MGFYKTRKHQIEAEGRRFRKGEISLNELLHVVSYIGVCAERERIIKIVRGRYGDSTEDEIDKVPIGDVTSLPDDNLKVYNED